MIFSDDFTVALAISMLRWPIPVKQIQVNENTSQKTYANISLPLANEMAMLVQPSKSVRPMISTEGCTNLGSKFVPGSCGGVKFLVIC